MPDLARPVRVRRGSLRRRLTAFAGAAACLSALAASNTRADECPAVGSALETQGARLGALSAGADRRLEILAIGSSSTEGVGASSPNHAYPAVLAEELRRDNRVATVRNAGVGGELAAATLERLEAALKTGWPELVIWQVGTNDALAGVDELSFRATVERGVAAARAAGVPLLLIDPQFAARPPDAARYERFVAIVDETGARLKTPVLSRYAMMKRRGAQAARTLLSADGLHMNDLGYRCLAHAVAEAIENAAGAEARAEGGARAGAKL